MAARSVQTDHKRVRLLSLTKIDINFIHFSGLIHSKPIWQGKRRIQAIL
jgi:hypothetical protein